MELTKRFLFRGNASALSGLFYRPDTVIVDMPGASSLGVSGGRSQAQIPGRAFGDVIRFGSAMTFAEGLYDDEKQAKAVSDHKGLPEELNSTTNVAAEIRELAVGQKPLFRAKRIRGALVSKSPRGSGEPSIACGTGAIGAPSAPVSGGDDGAGVTELAVGVATRVSCDAQAASSARAGSSRSFDETRMIGTSGRGQGSIPTTRPHHARFPPCASARRGNSVCGC